jgi:undecaprenyl-diphosphatase
MTWFEAFIYGAVQGLTEYLPISSSAHLILAPLFLGKADPGLAFDVFLHGGTLAATLVYFRKDWWALASTLPYVGQRFKTKAGPGRPPWEVVHWKLVALGTAPALIAGAALHSIIESAFRGPATMVFTLVIGGIVLYGFDALCPKEKSLKDISTKTAILIGLIQCLALMPGVSRSGSTITAARALGFNREAAARFSFLLSAPVTAAALIFELRKWRLLLDDNIGALNLILGSLSSFVFGWLAIDLLLKLVRKTSYLPFAIYRGLLAAIIYYSLIL